MLFAQTWCDRCSQVRRGLRVRLYFIYNCNSPWLAGSAETRPVWRGSSGGSCGWAVGEWSRWAEPPLCEWERWRSPEQFPSEHSGTRCSPPPRLVWHKHKTERLSLHFLCFTFTEIIHANSTKKKKAQDYFLSLTSWCYTSPLSPFQSGSSSGCPGRTGLGASSWESEDRTD